MFRLTKLACRCMHVSRKNSILKMQKRYFSEYDVAKQELKTTLNEEIAAEHEQEIEKDEFVDKFLKQTDWDYNTSLDSTRMTLTRQVDGVNVKVIYHARAQTFQDEEENAEDQE